MNAQAELSALKIDYLNMIFELARALGTNQRITMVNVLSQDGKNPDKVFIRSAGHTGIDAEFSVSDQGVNYSTRTKRNGFVTFGNFPELLEVIKGALK
jgi:hypothetical protein